MAKVILLLTVILTGHTALVSINLTALAAPKTQKIFQSFVEAKYPSNITLAWNLLFINLYAPLALSAYPNASKNKGLGIAKVVAIAVVHLLLVKAISLASPTPKGKRPAVPLRLSKPMEPTDQFRCIGKYGFFIGKP